MTVILVVQITLPLIFGPNILGQQLCSFSGVKTEHDVVLFTMVGNSLVEYHSEQNNGDEKSKLFNISDWVLGA